MLVLSNKWAPILISQPETGMSFQIASIFLKNGSRFDRVVITGGYIVQNRREQGYSIQRGVRHRKNYR